jgi:hypothetical protein
MKADPEFTLVLERWGSEKAVHAFLKKEFDRINKAAFGGNVEMPILQIKPMEQNATGNYAAAERHPRAVIGIFMNEIDPVSQVDYKGHFEFTLKDGDGFDLMSLSSQPVDLLSGRENVFQGVGKDMILQSVASKTKNVLMYLSLDKCQTCE